MFLGMVRDDDCPQSQSGSSESTLIVQDWFNPGYESCLGYGKRIESPYWIH
jgi:hypothetical protein